MYYDQLGGIRLSDQSADYTTALSQERRPLARRQDDHVPPESGIHWSDGMPFTSADAVWTFNAVLENRTKQLHGDDPGRQIGLGARREHVRPAPLHARLGVPRQARDADPAEAHLVEVPDREARQDRRADPDGDDGAVHPHQVGEDRHHDPDPQPQVRPFRNGGKLPEVKRILITYYANPDSIYRDVSQGTSTTATAGRRLGAARKTTRTRGPSDLLAARRLLGDRVQLLPARPARRSAAGRAKAST